MEGADVPKQCHPSRYLGEEYSNLKWRSPFGKNKNDLGSSSSDHCGKGERNQTEWTYGFPRQRPMWTINLEQPCRCRADRLAC
jgi:hypothetical protein